MRGKEAGSPTSHTIFTVPLPELQARARSRGALAAVRFGDEASPREPRGEGVAATVSAAPLGGIEGQGSLAATASVPAKECEASNRDEGERRGLGRGDKIVSVEVIGGSNDQRSPGLSTRSYIEGRTGVHPPTRCRHVPVGQIREGVGPHSGKIREKCGASCGIADADGKRSWSRRDQEPDPPH